jgi:catechol 2,3-dioxygenase-like lactoylglutathione lyase family enzyme
MSELEAGIVTGDPELLVAFYERVFGFELTTRLEFAGTGVVLKLRRGAARIKLFAPQPAATERVDADPWYGSAGWRYAALYLESEDALRTIVAAVDGSGGGVLLAPSSHRADAVVAVVRDPEGNVWELLWEAPTGGENIPA